jgi:hypothetical protein
MLWKKILQDLGLGGVFLYEDMKESQFMKRILPVLLAGIGVAGSLCAEPTGASRPTPPEQQQQQADKEKVAEVFSRFDLEFPGGTPADLVKAIQQSNGKPLNAIIPPEDGDVKLPPLKMKGVTVAELFDVLARASQKRVTYVTGTYFNGSGNASKQYQSGVSSYGFQCLGTPREDSIWYFHSESPGYPELGPDEPATICRFYQLEPYLKKYTVEDITTAIETGWKMLDPREQPKFGKPGTGMTKISFHKDTKLLIAVGEPGKLKMIDSVLEQLRPQEERPTATAGQATKEQDAGAKKKPEEKPGSGETDNK